MRLMSRSRPRRDAVGRERGQALVEFALTFPLFVLVLFSLIVLALYVFYNQQLENATREAARYAAVHSTRAQCPTVSRLDPIGTNREPDKYIRCDAPENGWPQMTGKARSMIWGMASNQVKLSACWSGFVNAAGEYDALPEAPNVFTQCTIGGVNPQTDPGSLACPPPTPVPFGGFPPASGDDKASSLAFANGRHYPTTVTVYACFPWTPPMAGFLFIPSTITLKAVVTEEMQRQ
jgi:hypothetical protein